MSLFKDENSVSNICQAKKNLLLQMTAGKNIISREADIPGVGYLYFDYWEIANLSTL